jgi:hypothetical protein
MVRVVVSLSDKNEVLGGEVGDQFLEINGFAASQIHDLAGAKAFRQALDGACLRLRMAQPGTPDDAQADQGQNGGLNEGHRFTSPGSKKDRGQSS